MIKERIIERRMRLIRRYYRSRLTEWRAKGHRERRQKRPVRGLIVTVLWPALQAVHFLRGLREELVCYGSAVNERVGVPKWRQAIGILHAGLRFGVPPLAYYQYRLYEPEFWSHARYFIHHHFMHVLLNHPPYAVTDHASDVLWNKLSFSEHCRSRDLPAIPVLAVVDGDGVHGVSWMPDASLPERDLFSKGLDLLRGMGARRWFFVERDRYRGENGVIFDSAGILEELQRESEEAGYTLILQERMTNHPDIEHLCGETFMSLRIITCLKPGRSSGSEYLEGTAKLPVRSSAATDVEPGGGTLYSAIDDAGVLGKGVPLLDLARIMDEVDLHPVSGAPINGFRVPYWEETVDLVLRAHDTIPGIPSIGWDIGVTERGPILIEGNVGWGSRTVQVPQRTPLGRTIFAEHYAAYLETPDNVDVDVN